MIRIADVLDEPFVGDDVLVERARVGSASAFAELIMRYRDAAYAIVRNLSRTGEETEQVLQKAFLGAWRQLPSFPSGARFSTWLYRIATNAALARLANERPNRLQYPLDAFLPVFDSDDRLVASTARWPDRERRHPERIAVTEGLRAMLECMDVGARAAFVLCDVVDLHAEETAVILEISPPAARRDVHRARLLLRGFLERTSNPDALAQ